MKRPLRKPVRRKRPLERVGMGDLISLTIELPDGKRRVWRFRERPALTFDYVSRDAKGRGRQARLYVDCGHYRVDAANRLRALATPRTKSTKPVSAATRAMYRLTHGGLDAREVYSCPVRPAGRKRYVGRCVQLDYRSDKGNDREWFYHPVTEACRPQVWVSASGRQVFFRGGQYTVTPHGIEDLE